AHELEARELVVERGLVRHVAGHRLGGLGGGADVVAVQDRRPRRRLEQANHHADGGGLAGAVRPEEPEHLSGGDLEIEIVHRDHGAVCLAERDAADHRTSSSRANWRLPMTPARASWRSAPPATSFTWVASTGICSNTESALIQRPSQSSVQA